MASTVLGAGLGGGIAGGRGRDSAWNVTAATEATGAATGVAGGEEGVEAEAGDEDRQEGETQPPPAQLSVPVITGTDILVWNTFQHRSPVGSLSHL